MPSPKSTRTARKTPNRIQKTIDEASGHDVPTEQGFAAGHDVLLRRRFPPRKAAPGPYKVMAQLPPRDGQFQYRIKSGSEPFFRTVAESEIEQA